MKKWVLKIELDREWEECVFTTREEALTAFIALASDYDESLRRAVLLPIEAEADFLANLRKEQRSRGYVQ